MSVEDLLDPLPLEKFQHHHEVGARVMKANVDDYLPGVDVTYGDKTREEAIAAFHNADSGGSASGGGEGELQKRAKINLKVGMRVFDPGVGQEAEITEVRPNLIALKFAGGTGLMARQHAERALQVIA